MTVDTKLDLAAQAEAIKKALGYVVSFAPVGASGLPQAGSFTLSGGAEAAAAKKATLTAYAK